MWWNEEDLAVRELYERNVKCCVVNIVEILGEISVLEARSRRKKVFSVRALCSSQIYCIIIGVRLVVLL